jgi:hypothetical protein
MPSRIDQPSRANIIPSLLTVVFMSHPNRHTPADTADNTTDNTTDDTPRRTQPSNTFAYEHMRTPRDVDMRHSVPVPLHSHDAPSPSAMYHPATPLSDADRSRLYRQRNNARVRAADAKRRSAVRSAPLTDAIDCADTVRVRQCRHLHTRPCEPVLTATRQQCAGQMVGNPVDAYADWSSCWSSYLRSYPTVALLQIHHDRLSPSLHVLPASITRFDVARLAISRMPPVDDHLCSVDCTHEVISAPAVSAHDRPPRRAAAIASGVAIRRDTEVRVPNTRTYMAPVTWSNMHVSTHCLGADDC